MSHKELSVNQLSDLTGIDRRTIKKRLESLTPRIEGRSHLYPVKEALALLHGGDAPATDNTGKSIETLLKEEELRIERAKREKLEIEVGRLRGELVSIEEVAREVEREYNFVRAQVRGIPSKLAKPLSLVHDPHEVHARLTEAVDECLSELTKDKQYEERSRKISPSDAAGDLPEDSSNAASEDEFS